MTEDRTAPQIDILLATYNGAAFLEEQIDSILRQSYRHWRLLVRDDGSTDRTVEILEQAAKDFPDKIVLIADGDGNLGCTGNFNRLMERSTADYAALCDQDDVWLEHKLALSMERMQVLERDHGSEKPILVHTDLCTVDQDLKTIGQSFWRYQGLNPADANDFARLLIRNVVTGCSMLLNRSLKERALPIPVEAKVHDWWIALVAAAFGVTDAVSTETTLYRQHASNTTGAKAFSGPHFFARATEFLANTSRRRVRLLETWRQAGAFNARYRGDLRPGDRRVLDDALSIPEAGQIVRVFRALKYGRLPPEGLYWIAFALFARHAGLEVSPGPTPLRTDGRQS